MQPGSVAAFLHEQDDQVRWKMRGGFARKRELVRPPSGRSDQFPKSIPNCFRKHAGRTLGGSVLVPGIPRKPLQCWHKNPTAQGYTAFLRKRGKRSRKLRRRGTGKKIFLNILHCQGIFIFCPNTNFDIDFIIIP